MLTHRPRRLRTTAPMRRLAAEHRLDPAGLLQPLFVKEGLSEPAPITSMPGVVQHTTDTVRRAAVEAATAGVGGIMLFAVPERRDALGSAADDPNGIGNRVLAQLAAEVGGDLVIISDLCLDEFTDHGHCGVLDAAGRVDNDATLERYRSVGLAQAEAGADLLGLSGMMDGQVGAVRAALDAAGRPDTGLLAYAAKYSSAFYGPFRDAVESQLTGDRRAYQQDPANRREAAREVALDVAEGADIVMVKPALAYLDIVADAARAVDIPVAAYQVSGEYAMVEAAAAAGFIGREATILETLLAIRRAGASIIATYWATEVARSLREGR